MKYTIVTVGKLNLGFARIGFEEYIKRLGGFCNVKVINLKEIGSDRQIHELMRKKYSIVLDEHGKEFDSKSFAEFLDSKKNEGISDINFFVGGPNGHSDEIIRNADLLWSLSKLTFPHDIASMLLSEALYRASTISAGHPYHRE